MVVASVWPYVLLGVALLIALGFEFVNGFHDTANAVATVIYTVPARSEHRGGVVGTVQPGRSTGVERRCSVQRDYAAAG